MSFWSYMAVSSVALIGAIFSAHAQKIEASPEQQIRSLTNAEIDAAMQEVASQINRSAPIRSDEWTTVQGAVFIKPTRILNYRVSLSQSKSAQAVAQAMRTGFCAGRTNLAFMDRGISYQYSITTPSESYIITFSRKDC